MTASGRLLPFMVTKLAEHLDGIPAALLGAVHGFVAIAQQIAQIVSQVGIYHHADA
ncbi:hypothetical protein D3C72_1074440 [compost metagenome]